jgi:2-dehydropantoate 2-reductase
MEKDLWAKVLYNQLLNPLGALVGVTYGVLGERAQTRSVMDALARETFEVMRAAGFECHWDSADEYLAVFYAKLLPPTAFHQSSMLQDLQAGRETEIEQLCGVIAQLAERHGVEAPINQALLVLIRAAERRPGVAVTGPESAP